MPACMVVYVIKTPRQTHYSRNSLLEMFSVVLARTSVGRCDTHIAPSSKKKGINKPRPSVTKVSRFLSCIICSLCQSSIHAGCAVCLRHFDLAVASLCISRDSKNVVILFHKKKGKNQRQRQQQRIHTYIQNKL